MQYQSNKEGCYCCYSNQWIQNSLMQSKVNQGNSHSKPDLIGTVVTQCDDSSARAKQDKAASPWSTFDHRNTWWNCVEIQIGLKKTHLWTSKTFFPSAECRVRAAARAWINSFLDETAALPLCFPPPLSLLLPLPSSPDVTAGVGGTNYCCCSSSSKCFLLPLSYR